MVHYSILHHRTIEGALSYRISLKLANGEMSEQILREICDEAYADDRTSHMPRAPTSRPPTNAIRPATATCSRLLFFKGFQAVQA
jgi:serine O-acetyltransferase